MKSTRRRALYVIAALLGALFVLACMAGFAACGGDACADGHTWDDGVVTTAATCEGTGVTTYTCTVCGDTKTETIAALGHDYSVVSTDVADGYVAATCTTPGKDIKKCSRCGAIQETTIDALGHQLIGTYTAPTGNETTGTWTYTCSREQGAEVSSVDSTTPVASVTLKATDMASFEAAVIWGEVSLEDVTVVLEDNVYIIVDNTSEATTYTADNPQEIKLNADIEVGSNGYLQFRGNWKLDLNGHSISKVGTDTTGNYATIYVGSGSSSVNAANRYGNLTVCDTSNGAAGSIEGVTSVTVQGVQNTSSYTSKFTLESGTLVGSNFALGTNGTNSLGAEAIIVSGGTVSGGDTGIYLPNGSLTVTGGTISGKTGIEVKAGTASITGGTISTTVADGTTSIVPNTNGTESSGYSIAIITNTSYNDITSVTIGSGVILSGNIYVDSSIEDTVVNIDDSLKGQVATDDTEPDDEET